MNLFNNIDQPIINVLTRIYKRNGQYIEAKHKYKTRRKTK